MISIGDYVACEFNGRIVKGTVIKQYYPTACPQQTMILCDDSRQFHAPTNCFYKINKQVQSEILKVN